MNAFCDSCNCKPTCRPGLKFDCFRHYKILTKSVGIACLVGIGCGWEGNLQAQSWTNTTLTASQRASLLLAQMTFSEKVAMVNGASGPYVGNIPVNTRLGIPALTLKDGPAGVRLSDTSTTAFPAPIDIAASWDTALARRYGVMLGSEARGKGVEVLLGPMMNVARSRGWKSL